jgi:pterin-4a-carbinolamine dehydratase
MSQVVPTQSAKGPETVTERLKSERVEEMLAVMPAWTVLPQGQAIGRVFQFPSTRVAAAFARFVSAYAREEGHNIYMDISKVEVDLTLTGPKKQGRCGDLTEEIVSFAQKLG